MSHEDSSTDPHPTPDQPVKPASGQVGKDLKRASEDDRPLGIVSNLTKEAPLQALAIAFLLGVLIGRRR